MQKNTVKDICTTGLVLRRTNYAEADRILNLLTPNGKISVIARGVRKARSKLAGGVEMFTLSDYNIHFGRGELGIVTGVKMVEHFDAILKDYQRIELAGQMLKKVGALAEGVESDDYFKTILSGLKGLNAGYDCAMIQAWFGLRLKQIMGEEINLYRDANGEKLLPGSWYEFDVVQGAFVEKNDGRYGVNEIKLLRLMATTDFELVRRVKVNDKVWERAIEFARAMA